MKKLAHWLPFFWLSLGLGFGAAQDGRASDPLAEGQRLIRIQVEWIEMSLEKHTELMADPEKTPSLRSSNDGALRRTLTEWIKKGDARFLNTASVVARSGQRARVESVQEMIYPTEYNPPTWPLPREVEEQMEKARNEIKARSVPIASAFETRNVGVTLEIDPVIGSAAALIDLNLSPEIVYHGGTKQWGSEKDMTTSVPLFFAAKLTTQITVLTGQYSMAAVLSPMNAATGAADSSRKVMVFVKADLLVVGMPLPSSETLEVVS